MPRPQSHFGTVRGPHMRKPILKIAVAIVVPILAKGAGAYEMPEEQNQNFGDDFVWTPAGAWHGGPAGRWRMYP